MENQEVEVSNTQHSIKWGVIVGLISIIISLIVYLIDITLLLNPVVSIGSIVLYFVLVVFAGRDFRTRIGGYMSFKDAFLHSFVLLAISGFLGTLFNILLFTVIDPEIVPVLVEAQMESSMKMMESFGGANNEMMDGMAEGIKKGYTVTGQAMGFLWMLVVYAIGSLIVGAINKKRNKEEEF